MSQAKFLRTPFLEDISYGGFCVNKFVEDDPCANRLLKYRLLCERNTGKKISFSKYQKTTFPARLTNFSPVSHFCTPWNRKKKPGV